MSYRHYLEELKKELPLPAYLLAASDPFLHSEAVSALMSLVPQGERDFNFHSFDLADSGGVPIDQILDVLNTVPFFEGRKFVVIENFQKVSKKDLRKVERYLENPSGGSVMVILNAGAVKKEVKESLKGIRQILLDIGERDIPVWVRTKAMEKSVEMSDSAIDYLIGTVGADLGLLSSEIDKCALIGKAIVEKEDMAEIVESKKTYNAFALVDAIGAGDTERAFRIYKVLRETEEPYTLLGALNWQYGRHLAFKKLPAERDHYFRIFEEIQKADTGIKSSGSSYPMELLLTKLLGLSRRN